MDLTFARTSVNLSVYERRSADTRRASQCSHRFGSSSFSQETEVPLFAAFQNLSPNADRNAKSSTKQFIDRPIAGIVTLGDEKEENDAQTVGNILTIQQSACIPALVETICSRKRNPSPTSFCGAFHLPDERKSDGKVYKRA